MDSKKIKIYLLNDFNFIMGEDSWRKIKNAVRIVTSMKGEAGIRSIYSLMANVAFVKSISLNISKKYIRIMDVIDPKPETIGFYEMFISGKKPQIEVPKNKHGLN